MKEERTFVAIKPDGVKRGLIGKIISRFEDKGFNLMLSIIKLKSDISLCHNKF